MRPLSETDEMEKRRPGRAETKAVVPGPASTIRAKAMGQSITMQSRSAALVRARSYDAEPSYEQ